MASFSSEFVPELFLYMNIRTFHEEKAPCVALVVCSVKCVIFQKMGRFLNVKITICWSHSNFFLLCNIARSHWALDRWYSLFQCIKLKQCVQALLLQYWIRQINVSDDANTITVGMDLTLEFSIENLTSECGTQNECEACWRSLLILFPLLNHAFYRHISCSGINRSRSCVLATKRGIHLFFFFWL